MSHTTISDGKGKGNKAEVNENQQLSVISESIPSEGARAQDGEAFIIHFECHTAAAPSGGFMHILNNDAEFELEVTGIYIDPHTLTPSDLIVLQVFDPIISNGTDVSSTAVVQKNRGSASPFDLTIKVSDSSSDLTYSDGTQYLAFPAKSMTGIQRNMNGTNILPAGKAILFGWKTRDGSNAVDGEVVSFSVNIIKRKKA